MAYRLEEQAGVRRRADALFVRDRAKYQDIKRLIRTNPYPPNDRGPIRKVRFDDGMILYAYEAPSFRYQVLYTIYEPPEGGDGEVRIVALIDISIELR